MHTRSQTRANREAAQKHVEDYLANVRTNRKFKKEAVIENQSIIATTTETKTPQKQPDTKTEPQAPTKKPKTDTITSNTRRYRTRLSTGAIERQNLTEEFDEAFFDDASKEWNENKTKIGNGMYEYKTRSNKEKIDNIVTTWIHSNFGNKSDSLTNKSKKNNK